MASCSASIFERVYGPGMASAASRVSPATASPEGEEPEKNGFGRAVQEPGNAVLARGRNNDLCAPAIDGMKIVLVRKPHARQAGKVIDLTDVAHRLLDDIRIQHRTFDVLHVRQGVRWRVEIENARLSSPRDQRRYQVLSDEAAAAGDEDPSHECGCGSP